MHLAFKLENEGGVDYLMITCDDRASGVRNKNLLETGVFSTFNSGYSQREVDERSTGVGMNGLREAIEEHYKGKIPIKDRRRYVDGKRGARVIIMIPIQPSQSS